VVAEIQDAALLRALAVARGAIFPGHLALQEEIERATGSRLLGPCPGLRQRFWAITAERRLTHPGVVAITQSARRLLRKG
jgi:LysR family transcriptional activator of nhaA